MSLAGLVGLVGDDPPIAAALQGDVDGDLVVPPAATATTLAALTTRAANSGLTVVAVTATTREADDLTAALGSLLDPDTVGNFPSWETLPHERLSPRSDTVGRRIAVLRRLSHPDPDDPGAGALAVVVAPVRALLQPFACGLGDLEPVRLHVGDTVDVDGIVRQLVEGGYTRTDIVERRGELAVRGGILDVFPAVEEHPLRVELWGDEIEEIRWFKAADQRSLEVAPHGLWAPPTRELPLTEEVRQRAASAAGTHAGLADVLTQLADGIAVEGMESLTPLLANGMELLVDVVRERSVVVLVDPERVRSRSVELHRTSEEFLAASWANAASGNATPLDLGSASYKDLPEVEAVARRRAAAVGRRRAVRRLRRSGCPLHAAPGRRVPR